MSLKIVRVTTLSKEISPFIVECLKGKNCSDCNICKAEMESWKQLELDFKESGKNFIEDLQIYYQVKGKRKIFKQDQQNAFLTLSEPEALQMLSRY